MASASFGLELPATSLIAPFLAGMALSRGWTRVCSMDGRVIPRARKPMQYAGFHCPESFSAITMERPVRRLLVQGRGRRGGRTAPGGDRFRGGFRRLGLRLPGPFDRPLRAAEDAEYARRLRRVITPGDQHRQVWLRRWGIEEGGDPIHS